MVVVDGRAAEVGETAPKGTVVLRAADVDPAVVAVHSPVVAQTPAAAPRRPRSRLVPASLESKGYAGCLPDPG